MSTLPAATSKDLTVAPRDYPVARAGLGFLLFCSAVGLVAGVTAILVGWGLSSLLP